MSESGSKIIHLMSSRLTPTSSINITVHRVHSEGIHKYKHMYVQTYTHTYQLFVVVGGEVPHMDGATLVPNHEGSLVGVQTHASHRSIHLEQTLALLGTTTGNKSHDIT